MDIKPCCDCFRAYEAQTHTAAEVKAEVEMHLKEKVIIESILPSNITIGPFYVNTDNVRQALCKKRKALSNAVLELLARKLRTQADEVSIICCLFCILFLSSTYFFYPPILEF